LPHRPAATGLGIAGFPPRHILTHPG